MSFKPELEVTVSIDQPLLNEEEFSKCNLLTVTMEAMYALPESWVNTTKEYAYTVSLPIPLNDDVCLHLTLLYTNNLVIFSIL